MEYNMSNPDEAATQNAFETQVTEALDVVKRGDDGKLEFEEGTSEEVIYAATSEIRRRDTQAQYTKEKQSNVALKAEKDELLVQLSSEVKLELTAEQEDELDELKFSDPELWRSKLNVYETEAKEKQTKLVGERLKEVSAKGTEAAEIERRQTVLTDFKAANPEFVIDDDVIANDIPPRISNKLKNNEVTFEEFLQEAHDYLKSGKVVAATEEVLNQPNLSNAGGGDNPSDDAVNKKSEAGYASEVY